MKKRTILIIVAVIFTLALGVVFANAEGVDEKELLKGIWELETTYVGDEEQDREGSFQLIFTEEYYFSINDFIERNEDGSSPFFQALDNGVPIEDCPPIEGDCLAISGTYEVEGDELNLTGDISSDEEGGSEDSSYTWEFLDEDYDTLCLYPENDYMYGEKVDKYEFKRLDEDTEDISELHGVWEVDHLITLDENNEEHTITEDNYRLILTDENRYSGARAFTTEKGFFFAADGGKYEVKPNNKVTFTHEVCAFPELGEMTFVWEYDSDSQELCLMPQYDDMKFPSESFLGAAMPDENNQMMYGDMVYKYYFKRVESLAKKLPFIIEGAGDFSYVISDSIHHINSWEAELVDINGQDYTNCYTDIWENPIPMPQKINGKYYFHYIGAFDWSHLEVIGIGGDN